MSKKIPMLFMYLGGIFFGFGLAYSGAARPDIVLTFLHLEDLGLFLVIGIALLIVMFAIQVIPKLVSKPPLGERFDCHDGFPVTKRSFVGAIIFGIGWGVSGLCPATSLTAVGMGNWPVALGVLGMFIGALIYGTIRSKEGSC